MASLFARFRYSRGTGFVVFVDPYDLYRIYNTKGVNAVKPVLPRYVDEIKLARAVKLQPDTLILGNSGLRLVWIGVSALKKRGILLTTWRSEVRLLLPPAPVGLFVLKGYQAQTNSNRRRFRRFCQSGRGS